MASSRALPLKATVRISIHEPGGRTTDKSVIIPIRTHDAAIGIRPVFDSGQVAENARAGFEVIAVDAEGTRDLFPENWRLARRGDYDGFATSVLHMVDHYASAKRDAALCGARARDIFSSHLVTDKTMEVYSAVHG